MANRNWSNGGKLFAMHTSMVLVDCNFVVDSTNGNGLGIRSLKGPAVASVFMNTTPAATTASSVFSSGATQVVLSRNITALVIGMVVTDTTTGGNIAGGTTVTGINVATNTVTLSAATLGNSASAPGDTLSFAMTAALAGNPNPAAGVIVVNLQDDYNQILTGSNSIVAPLTGSNLTSITSGTAYVITSLGTTTAAQWAAAGIPTGFTPAVGMPFIGKESTSIGGTGTVKVIGNSGITNIETIGDANTLISNSSATTGAQIILQCEKNAALTAPTDGTVISLVFLMSNSNVKVQGE